MEDITDTVLSLVDLGAIRTVHLNNLKRTKAPEKLSCAFCLKTLTLEHSFKAKKKAQRNSFVLFNSRFSLIPHSEKKEQLRQPEN